MPSNSFIAEQSRFNEVEQRGIHLDGEKRKIKDKKKNNTKSSRIFKNLDNKNSYQPSNNTTVMT